jgi:outer membrane protein TolC
MQTVQMQLAAMERTVAETERRVATGAAHQLASLEAEGDLLRLKSELELLARTAELRRDFLQEKVDAAAASTGLNRLRTMRELEILQREHALSAQRLSLLEAQQNAGEVGELEVLRTQLAQAEREMEIKNLRARLALLGRGR